MVQAVPDSKRIRITSEGDMLVQKERNGKKREMERRKRSTIEIYDSMFNCMGHC